MIDQKAFENLLPLAYQWAHAQEQFVLARGTPLGPRERADAQLAGVDDASRVRVLVVDRIPLPYNEALAEASRRAQIITEASRGVAIGHAIIIRADSWGDRELLVHQFVHVGQCERSGGLEQWVRQYLSDRRGCAQFTTGSLEEEARRVAHEVCAGEPVAH